MNVLFRLHTKQENFFLLRYTGFSPIISDSRTVQWVNVNFKMKLDGFLLAFCNSAFCNILHFYNSFTTLIHQLYIICSIS